MFSLGGDDTLSSRDGMSGNDSLDGATGAGPVPPPF
jgi:hypothetical protein